MSSRAMGNIPLAFKNRLGYVPPKVESKNFNDVLEPESIDDLPPTQQQKSSRKFTTESILTLLSTSYSLIFLAFFKSLMDHVKSAATGTKSVNLPPTLPNHEQHDLSFESGFPGESTPINASLIEEEIHESANSPISDHSKTENPTMRRNIYDSIFELDSSDDDDLDIRAQYGTTLQISEASKYKPQSEIAHAPEYQDDVTAAELLDTEFPSLDEYDKVVRDFYIPIKPVPPPKYSLTNAMLATIPSYDFSQFLKNQQEKIQKLISEERKASQSKISQLQPSQLETVENLWKSRNINQPVVSDFAIDITVKDIKTLADSCWLNDNVIDFYLSLLSARSGNIFCWTTHFFTTLKSKGYSGVARWARRKKVNLFEKDLVIVPINIMGTHWALAVIDNQAKSISYYDSLSSHGNIRALESLNEYMAKESERLSVPQITYTLYPNMKTPQQQNGFDCGVFTCTAAKFLSERAPLTFSQKDMRLIRRRMAYEIINKDLLGGASSGPHL